MISKPPSSYGKKPEEWIQEFLRFFNEVAAEFAKVKTVWYPVQGSDQEGNHPGKEITAGNSAYFGFVFGRDVNQIKEVVCRFIPTTTGTIDYSFALSRGAVGADEAAGSAALTADGLSVTDDLIAEIDVTTLFSDAVKNDQVGVKMTLDAVATTTNIKVLGLYFKYI